MTGVVRIAQASDLPAINAIYNQAVAGRFLTGDLEPVGARRRRQWFKEHDPERHPVYVYEKDGQVLGWLSISAYRPGRGALQDTAELSYYVDNTHQGEGIGSRLMDHAIRESLRMKKRVLFAIVIAGNQASLGLLKKFGFEQWGVLHEVIAAHGEVRDQVVLGKILTKV
jgi:phosphinothricin acetyltransferase